MLEAPPTQPSLLRLREPGDAAARRVAPQRSPRLAGLVLFLLPALAGGSVLLVAPPPARSPQPKPGAEAPALRTEYPEDFHPTLQGNSEEIPGLLIFGPDAAQCVKFEAEGLRITLPADYPREHPGIGVITDFGVRGDFEISVRYEILPGTNSGMWGNPTGLKLVVVPDNPVRPGQWHRTNQNRAILSREAPVRTKTGLFHVDSTRWNGDNLPKDKWGNENFTDIELHAHTRTPAIASTGRLRLVRSGANLFFFASEEADKEFTLLFKSAFGKDNLKNVRILGSTGGPGASLDVRVTDVRIRAEAFLKAEPEPVQPGPPARPRKWLVSALALSAVSAVLLGVFLYLRARRPAPAARPAPASTIGVLCSGCGKRLKARRELAGKKLKCPHCSQTVVVPEAPMVSPEEPA